MPTISAATHTFDLEGRTVLFEEQSTKLFVLNACASSIWNRLRKGHDPDEIAAELSEHGNVSRKQVSRDVANLLRQWESDGLVNQARQVAKSGKQQPQRTRRLRQNRRGTEDSSFGVARSAVVSGTYQLADHRFRFTIDADICNMLDAVIGHLAFDEATEIADLPHYELYWHNDNWTLRSNKRLLAQCTEREEIAPMIHANMLAATYHGSDSFVAIHAAAISNGTDCVLLPAVSGCGKSTLTAALVASGLIYCTDDLALLTPPPLRLRPAPLCIGVKSGSWDVLSERLPGIAALPAYRRADKKRIRYLLPKSGQLTQIGCAPLPVKAMIFPVYRAGASMKLTTLEKGDALLRMLHAGYDLHDGLDREWVGNIVSWIKSFPSYELQFDELDPAVDAIRRTLQ